MECGTGAWCSVLTDHSLSQEIDNEPDKYRIFRPLVVPDAWVV